MKKMMEKIAILKIHKEFLPVIPTGERLERFFVGVCDIDSEHLSKHLKDLIKALNWYYKNPTVMIFMLRKFFPIEVIKTIVDNIIIIDIVDNNLNLG